jgi:hypothetical protein
MLRFAAMETGRMATISGWVVAALLIGYLAYDRMAKTEPAPPTQAPRPVATATPPPLPPPSTDPTATPTPDVAEMLNRMFPSTGTKVGGEPGSAAATPPPQEPSANTAPPPAAPGQPEISAADREKQKAAFLVPQFEAMGSKAAELATLERDHSKICTGVIEVPFKDQTGMAVRGTMNRADTPECKAHQERTAELKTALPREAAQAQEAARKANVLPGLLREMIASYKLGAYFR